MALRCPNCGAELDLDLALAEPEPDEALERRDAWAAAEDAALLREAQQRGKQ